MSSAAAPARPRTPFIVTAGGLTATLSTWARATGINAATIYARLRFLGWSPEAAVSTPAGGRRGVVGQSPRESPTPWAGAPPRCRRHPPRRRVGRERTSRGSASTGFASSAAPSRSTARRAGTAGAWRATTSWCATATSSGPTARPSARAVAGVPAIATQSPARGRGCGWPTGRSPSPTRPSAWSPGAGCDPARFEEPLTSLAASGVPLREWAAAWNIPPAVLVLGVLTWGCSWTVWPTPHIERRRGRGVVGAALFHPLLACRLKRRSGRPQRRTLYVRPPLRVHPCRSPRRRTGPPTPRRTRCWFRVLQAADFWGPRPRGRPALTASAGGRGADHCNPPSRRPGRTGPRCRFVAIWRPKLRSCCPGWMHGS